MHLIAMHIAKKKLFMLGIQHDWLWTHIYNTLTAFAFVAGYRSGFRRGSFGFIRPDISTQNVMSF